MIVHSITIYKPSESSWKQSSPSERQAAIFAKTLKKLDTNKYKCGELYKVKATGEVGTLIYICDKDSEVEWSGMKVRMLELWFSDSQQTELFHPSDLKEVVNA